MKLFKILMLFLISAFAFSKVSGQANGYINILTQNGGLVNVGGSVFIEVTVGNSGPVDNIPTGKIRIQISVPGSITSIPATGHVLPTGWTIISNSGTSIQVCNNSDAIPLFEERTILIKVQGTNIGGPSTIIGQLDFRNNCSTPGSLNGDDASDNSSTSSIQVIPSCPLTVTASAGTIICNGGTTTLTATITNASGAVEYSLNGGPFQAANTFTVNAAGSPYVVSAREVSTPTCTAISNALSITEPPLVTAPVISQVTQPTCITATGSVDLSGMPAGNWTITRNPDAVTTTGTGTSTTITGLPSGTYSFTITNAAGCTSAASASVTINIQPATPAIPIIGTITQPDCSVSTGSVVLSGLPPGNWTINPGNIPGNTSSATINVNPGTYHFTVTNASGCTSAATSDVIINDVPGSPAAPAVTVVQPTCTLSTGTINITSSTTGLLFSLDGAAYADYPADGYIVTPGQHTIIAQNSAGCLSAVTHVIINEQPATPAAPTVTVVQPTCTIATAIITITSATTGLTFSFNGAAFATYPVDGYTVTTGVHTLTAQNADGCVSAITGITVNEQPTPPTVTTAAGTIACNGGTTTLTVTGSGGTGTLEYSLDGVTFQPGNTFTVEAGTHTVTVRDVNLCTGTATITVTQPQAIIASASTGSIACNGGTSALTIAATGGTPPLQYSLNGGVFQTGNIFIVGAGIYTVTVKDSNLCTTTAPAVTITQPATLTASATAKRITQCGGTTEVKVAASGGLAPYTSGIGTFIKGPGTWIFSVTDSGGCTDTTQITIEAPGCMNLKVFPNPAKHTITINHSVAEAGSIMQVYEISGALAMTRQVLQNAIETTIDVNKLAAGSYILVYLNGNEKKEALFVKTSSQ